MILWSFDFANDHAHAFFMDNVEWSHADSYFLSFVSDDVLVYLVLTYIF